MSASSLCRDGAGSTTSMLHNSHALILPQESHLSRGPPAHPAQGQGAVLVPPLPSPTVRPGRPGSAVQPKGRAGALPITTHAGNLSLCRAGRLLLPSAEGGDARLPWELAPRPLQGDTGALTAHAHQRPLVPGPRQASDLSMNWEQREERRGRKKKKGPVSQLWPFMPRAFGPSSKGIGFAEANDDTSTSSGAGSACCWRRATRVKKYCGHLIIDSLFLHYGRAQRPQLRLRPLCAHRVHARTEPGSACPESPVRGGQHCQSQHHSPLPLPALPVPW